MKVTVELSTDSVAALADAIAVRLKGVPTVAEAQAPDRFVTRGEATRMGVERRALLRAERSGQLAAFKPGRVVVYRRRDVEALVESHRVSGRHEGSETEENRFVDPFEKALQKAAKRAGNLTASGRG